MMVIKDKPIAIGVRGRFSDILDQLSSSHFTGIAEISYRLGEISRARVVFVDGNMVECRISKLISKAELVGEDALQELLGVENCVVDIYTMNEPLMGGSFNESDPRDVQGLNVEISPRTEISREEILRKYNIKEPTEEEIESIIKRAVEDVVETEPKEEFHDLKDELKKILNRHLGKLSKKLESRIDHLTKREDFMNLPQEIRNSKSLLIFIPKERLNKLAEEIQDLLSERLG
jgi:hypothetical protein